ncbi:APC family permease [Haloferula chungangensis]|uniref:APC family permease n=1 Tax=Haloferula chungangensis TaxID=1048331 RepID=A0ABW2LBG6_9BACT
MKTEVKAKAPSKKLGELASTAICGNDITSSCLYVSALAIIYGGRWGPVALLLVAAVLYLFRSIYSEVVGALPLNGGAYNALLNTTTKFRASIAACLTILSYMATAVISASEASHYAHQVIPHLPVFGATVGLLAFFMILTIMGISESAKLAIGIFLFHIVSLVVLLGAGIFYLSTHGLGQLMENLATPVPGGMGKALLFGFCAAMLGISGFESSANFVEEQKSGVFPKTLRNMWIAVSFFNPLMALLALALIPSSQVAAHESALLAHMGRESAGTWLGTLISIDAAIVLSGAVLTSFIGVNGLVSRMTLDRCLPQFLLKTNRRGTTHRILIAFFLLTVSVLFITHGDLKALAGVYTLSFLAVMLLFCIGNILLKIKRSSLPRPVRASWPTVILAMIAVSIGLIGNAVMNPPYLRVFAEYFIPAALIVVVMLTRTQLLKALLFTTRSIIGALVVPMNHLTHRTRELIDNINAQQVVFFSRGDNIANLNRVMLYVRQNEHSNGIKIVHIIKPGAPKPDKLAGELKVLNEAYPEIDIEFVVIEGSFNPALIKELSKTWKIPTNFMFIGCPDEGLAHTLEELGGVRVIV